MADEKRVINWNDGMRSDFHYLATGCNNGVILIYDFMEYGEDNYPSLYKHYTSLNEDEQTQFAQDLIDLYVGKAMFPEQFYYLKLPKMSFPYVSLNKEGFYDVYSEKNDKTKQTFTMSEIEAIDPRYKAFAIPADELEE